MANNESRQWLYDELVSRGHNVGADYDEFSKLMNENEESRRWAYDEMTNSGNNVGSSFEEFSKLIMDAPTPKWDNNTPYFQASYSNYVEKTPAQKLEDAKAEQEGGYATKEDVAPAVKNIGQNVDAILSNFSQNTPIVKSPEEQRDRVDDMLINYYRQEHAGMEPGIEALNEMRKGYREFAEDQYRDKVDNGGYTLYPISDEEAAAHQRVTWANGTDIALPAEDYALAKEYERKTKANKERRKQLVNSKEYQDSRNRSIERQRESLAEAMAAYDEFNDEHRTINPDYQNGESMYVFDSDEARNESRLLKEALDLQKKTLKLEKSPMKGSKGSLDTFAESTHQGLSALGKGAVEAVKENKFGRGVWDAINDPDFWTFGLSEVMRNVDFRNTMNHLAELTEQYGDGAEDHLSNGEKALIRSFFQNIEVQARRQAGMSPIYTGGQMAAQSIPFMVQFALTDGVASAVGEGVKKGVLNLVAKASTKAAESNLARFATGGLEGLAKTALRTVAMPATAQNIAQRYAEMDENGNFKYTPGQSVWLGGLSSGIENTSESFGAALGRMGIGEKQIAKLFANTPSKDFAKKLFSSGEFLAKGGWNGYFGENLEEWYGTFLRSLLMPQDGSFSEQWKDFVSKDNMIAMHSGFAPMAAFGMGGSAIRRRALRSDMTKMRDYNDKRQAQLNMALGLEEGKFRQEMIAAGVSEKDVDSFLNSRDGMSMADQIAKTKELLNNASGARFDSEADFEGADNRGAAAAESMGRILELDGIIGAEQARYDSVMQEYKDALEGKEETIWNEDLGFEKEEAPAKEQPVAQQPVTAPQAEAPVQAPVAEQSAAPATKYDNPDKQRFFDTFGDVVTRIPKDGRGGLNDVVPVSQNGQPVGYLVAITPGADGAHQYVLYNANVADGKIEKAVLSESEWKNGGYRASIDGIPENRFYSDFWKTVDSATNVAETAGADAAKQVADENTADVNAAVDAEKAQIVANSTPEEKNELAKEMSDEEFMASLPVFESGSKKGQLNYAAFTPSQTFKYTALEDGLDTAVQDARDRVADLQKEIEAANAKVASVTGPARAQLRSEIKAMSAELDEYNNILAQYEQEVPQVEAPVEEPAPVQAEAPVAEEPVQTPAPAAAPVETVEQPATKIEKPKREKKKKAKSTVAALSEKGGAKTAREGATAAAEPEDLGDKIVEAFGGKDQAKIREAKGAITAFTEMMDEQTASEEYARVQAERKDAEAGSPLRASLDYRLRALKVRLKELGIDPATIKPLEKETTPTTIPTTPTTSSTTQEDKASVEEQRPEAKEKSKQEPESTAAPVSETSSAEAPAPAPAVSDKTGEDAMAFINDVLKEAKKGKNVREVTQSKFNSTKYADDAVRQAIMDACDARIEELRANGGSATEISRLNNIKDVTKITRANAAKRNKVTVAAKDAATSVKELEEKVTPFLAMLNDAQHNGVLLSDDEYADAMRLFYELKELDNGIADNTRISNTLAETYGDRLRPALDALGSVTNKYRENTGRKHSEIAKNYPDLVEHAKATKAADEAAANVESAAKKDMAGVAEETEEQKAQRAALEAMRQERAEKKAEKKAELEEKKAEVKPWKEAIAKAKELSRRLYGNVTKSNPEPSLTAQNRADRKAIAELKTFGGWRKSLGSGIKAVAERKMSEQELADNIAALEANIANRNAEIDRIRKEIAEIGLEDIFKQYIESGNKPNLTMIREAGEYFDPSEYLPKADEVKEQRVNSDIPKATPRQIRLLARQLEKLLDGTGKKVQILGSEEFNKMLDAAREGKISLQQVFHGTHALLKKEGGNVVRGIPMGFDHRFMGSGEGAQAYGWGTYVATNPNIAKMYMANMVGSHPVFEEENWLTLLTRLQDKYEKYLQESGGDEKSAEWKFLFEDEDVAKLEEGFNGSLFYIDEDGLVQPYYKSERDFERNTYRDSWRDFLDNVEQTYPGMVGMKVGHLIEVDIPDEDGFNYLHWNEPITQEQEAAIKNELRNSGLDISESRFGETGQEYYNEISDILGGDRFASEFLNSIGIIGVNVPSRNLSNHPDAEHPNYVLFDDNTPVVTKDSGFAVDFSKEDENGNPALIPLWEQRDGGETAGFVDADGNIYINQDAARIDTPLHEIGLHAVMRIAKENGYQPLIDAINRYGAEAPEEFKQYVRDNYDLEEGSDAFNEEVAAFAFGQHYANKQKDFADRNAWQRLLDAIREFIRKIGDKIKGIGPMANLSAFDAVEKMAYEDIGEALYKLAMGGKSLLQNTEENTNFAKESTPQINISQDEYTDDFRRVQEESQRLLPEDVSQFHRGGFPVPESDALRQRLGGVYGRLLAGGHGAGENVWTNLTGKGTTFRLTSVNGSLFHDIFEINQKYLPNGELVDLHDEYDYCKCFLSDDGLCGFAVEPNGNLVSVFSLNPSDKRGFLYAIADFASKQGANHLDAFASPNQNLEAIYQKTLGYQTAAEMDYNMEYDKDDIASNHNSPKVVFMVKSDKPVEKKHFNKDQYDEAVAYQMSLVEGYDKRNEDNESGIMEQRIAGSAAQQQYNQVEALAKTVPGRLAPSDWADLFKQAGIKDPVLYKMLSEKNLLHPLSADDIIDWADKRYQDSLPANNTVDTDRKSVRYVDSLIRWAKDNIHDYNVLRRMVREAGGIIPDGDFGTTYTNRLERGATVTEKFQKDYQEPLNKAAADIMKWAKENGIAMTEDYIGYYLLALNAPARNKWITVDKAKEAAKGSEGIPEDDDIANMYDIICLGNGTAAMYDNSTEGTWEVAKYLEKMKDPQARNWSGSDGVTSFDDESAAKIVETFEDTIPTSLIIDLRDAMRAASQRILQMSVDYGFESPESVARYNQRYPNYAPFVDWANDDEKKEKLMSFDNVGYRSDFLPFEKSTMNPNIRKGSHGRKTLPANPIAMILYKAANTAFTGEENRSRQMLYEMVNQNRNLSNLFYAEYVNSNGEVVPVGETPDWYTDMSEKERAKHGVKTYINGSPVTVYVNGDVGEGLHKGLEEPFNIITAARALNGKWKSVGDIMSAVHNTNTKVLGALSQVMTTYNPAFPPVNAVRDIRYAARQMFVQEGAEAAARFIKGLAPSFKECFNNMIGKPSKIFQEYMEDGGYIGYARMGSPEMYTKDVMKAIERVTQGNDDKSAREAIVNVLRAYAGMFENVARFAAYKAARDAGESRERAASLAHEVSTNLSRRGTQKALSAWTLFFNASLEGAAQQWRNLRDHTGRAMAMHIMQLGLSILSGLAMRALAAGAGDGDDDKFDWDKVNWDNVLSRDNAYNWLADHVKNGQTILPLGKNDKGELSGLVIHQPFMYRADAAVAEKLLQWMSGKADAKDFIKSSLDAIVNEYNPFSGTSLKESEGAGGKKSQMPIPSVLRPIKDVQWNVSSLGYPIYNEYRPNEAGATRRDWQNAKPGTNPLLVGASKYHMLPIKPESLEYLLSSTLGSYWNMFDFLTSKALGTTSEERRYGQKKLPLVGRFYTTGGGSMYDRLEELQKYAQREESYSNRMKDVLGEGEKMFDSEHMRKLAKGETQGAAQLYKNYRSNIAKLEKEYNDARRIAKNKKMSKTARELADKAALRAYEDGIRKLNYETWLAWEKARKNIIEGLKTVK